MASKKDLKKKVRYMCGDMAAECIIAKTVVPGVDEATMKEIVIKIAKLQSATLRKISFAFDKVAKDYENNAQYKRARHEYMTKAYRSLSIEFNQQVASIVKEMNAALPQAQKDLNKKSC